MMENNDVAGHYYTRVPEPFFSTQMTLLENPKPRVQRPAMSAGKKVQSSQNHVDGSQLPIKFYCFTILTREGSEFWLPCIHTLRQFGGLVIVEPAAWKLDDN